MSTKDNKGLRNYMLVTVCYCAFTLTDGALRMLVTGHFHALGYSPLSLASLFLLYEFFGVATNMLAGWIGTRTGLRFTLFIGLTLQVGALLLLSALSAHWSQAAQVAYVVAAQGLSGIAKDFTKMSAKSAIKLFAPKGTSGALFRWVALVTGSKNALKGLGFFLGGALLLGLGFRLALWGMASVLAIVSIAALLHLPSTLGKTKNRTTLREALNCGLGIKVLSLARLFLFGARDVWFVVGLPVFLVEELGWSFVQIGGYLALWIVGYGVIQALAPRALRRTGRGQHNDAKVAQRSAWLLAIIPLGIYLALQTSASQAHVVLIGLGVFGCVFAINSSVHSYLVLAYAEEDRVSVQVGYYYMANAAGRLLGTVLSGLAYQAGGIEACLLVAMAMVVAAALVSLRLPDTRAPSPTNYSEI